MASSRGASTKGQIGRGNTIFTIRPYRIGNIWVFDDAPRGISEEPFVDRTNEFINMLAVDIPNAPKGIMLLFSAMPFPGYQKKADRRESHMGGRWYYSKDLGDKFWLCGTLFAYFAAAPQSLYVRAEPLSPETE